MMNLEKRFRLLDIHKPKKNYNLLLTYLKTGEYPPKEELLFSPTPLFCSYVLECILMGVNVTKDLFEEAFNEDPNIVSLSEIQYLIRNRYGYSKFQKSFFLGEYYD